jgi:transposase
MMPSAMVRNSAPSGQLVGSWMRMRARSLNGPTFLAYVQQCLVPTLKRGETVLMDNLPVHKIAGVAEAIEAARATLIYLPKYSPDLNPIELAFSKLNDDNTSDWLSGPGRRAPRARPEGDPRQKMLPARGREKTSPD